MQELDVASLYSEYGDMVLARCRALLRNAADAEETCQEVFLRAHRYRRSFRGDASPSTWLYRVATNTCLMRIRSASRRREELVDGPDESIPSPAPSVSHEISQVQILASVLEPFDEITSAIVVYVYVDGLTHDEIAPLVGMSPSGVRKRLARFREGLTTQRRTAPPEQRAAPRAAPGRAPRCSAR